MYGSSFDEKGYGSFCEAFAKAWYEEYRGRIGAFDALHETHRNAIKEQFRAAMAQLLMDGYTINEKKDWFEEWGKTFKSGDNMGRIVDRGEEGNHQRRQGRVQKKSRRSIYGIIRSWTILF